MTVLYTNSSGRQVQTHSYSAGVTFRNCSRRYYLERLRGWREKTERASRAFGKAVEDSVQFYHQSGMVPGNAVSEFVRCWEPAQFADLEYTEKEGNWEDLNRMGQEMMRLYELRFPSLGLTDLRFQLNFEKVVFPHDEKYGDLKFTAYVDVLAKTKLCLSPDYHIPGDPDPQPCPDCDGEPRPIVVDIKTGNPVTRQKGMLRLDGQLRAYSWVTGYPDVGFLTFVKARPSYRRGDSATVLYGPEAQLGKSVTVLFAGEGFVHAVEPEKFEAFEQATEGLKGKALEVAKFQLSGEVGAKIYPPEHLTKTSIQFVVDRIPREMMEEAGQAIGNDIGAIVKANEDNFWPCQGGVRFPNNTCLYCPMRGICSENTTLRDELLVNISAAPEKDWIEELVGAEDDG